MRPVKISLEGFSAYRRRVDVDLEDVEYFSLSGPTGSGKSSLIDAMVFALYGRIPRLGGGMVAPVISTGAERARVALEFTVGGEHYTATKLVQRMRAGGAVIAEARLEHGETVLASGVREVNDAVEELLRLSYEDFTRTVVLPQGEFARFLTSPPGERQQLLRGLLGLDIYGKVRTLARSRESVAESRALDARTRLEALKLPGEEERKAARERSSLIDELADAIPAEEAKLSSVKGEASALQNQFDQLESAGRRLGDLVAPPRLEELGQIIYDVRQELDALEERRERLKGQRVELEEILSGLPSLEKLLRLRTVKDRIAEVEQRLESDDLADLESKLESAEADVARVGSEVEKARATVEETRITHAAHDLASHLSTGDVCPVCNNVVESPPERGEIPDLEHARAAVTGGEQALELARKQVAELTNQLAAARSERQSLEERHVELSLEAGNRDDLASLEATRRTVEKALEKLDAITENLHEIESPIRSKRRDFEELAEEQRSLGNRLMSQREALADLKPTPAESEDPIVQWKELLGWRDQRLEEVTSEIGVVQLRLAASLEEFERTTRAIVAKLERLEIEFDGQYAVSVVRAQEKARHLVEGHNALLKESEELSTRIDQSEHQAKVARSLGQHLRVDGFERWLMVGAISNLVDGANALLAQLSSDGYSLVADDSGSFDVIDHRNANETRPISTLSGGETFLVSLALALSLAETLAGSGGTGLDAIILDEGFGTLDEELLEVVASVLEDLASRGLMVGIVTHVKELAGLAPVRFCVTKEPDGATVELAS